MGKLQFPKKRVADMVGLSGGFDSLFIAVFSSTFSTAKRRPSHILIPLMPYIFVVSVKAYMVPFQSFGVGEKKTFILFL